MEGRGGMRRGSIGLGASDALAIILIILILVGSLGALLAQRDARFVSQTQQWLRLAVDHLSSSIFLPNQAAAEASPPAHKNTTR